MASSASSFPQLPEIDTDYLGEIYDLEDGEHEDVAIWKSLCNALTTVTILHSFTDKRQPVFDVKPLPDGSNIPHGSPVRTMWHWYRRWLTWLHYDSLIRLDEGTRAALRYDRSGYFRVNEDAHRVDVELHGLVADNMAMLTDSRSRVPFDGIKTPFNHYDSFRWLYQARLHLMLIFNNLSRAMDDAWDNDSSAYDAMAEAYETVSPVIQLFLSCLTVEQEFESSYTLWHVEDMLMSKRLNFISDGDGALMLPTEMTRLYRKWFELTVTRLHDIAARSRNIYEYRRLREWGYGRPWRKLLLLVDGTDEAKRNAVDQLSTTCLLGAWLGAGLLGVLPFDLRKLKEMELDSCIICMEDWQEGELLMRTHCDHYLHANCLKKFWDTEGSNHFSWRCPICRQAPPDLRDRVTINAEKAEDDFPAEWLLQDINDRRLIAITSWNRRQAGDDPLIDFETWCCLAWEMKREYWRAVMEPYNNDAVDNGQENNP